MTKDKKDIIINVLNSYGYFDDYLITDTRVYLKGETDINMAIEMKRYIKSVKAVNSVWSNTIYYKRGYRTFIALKEE